MLLAKAKPRLQNLLDRDVLSGALIVGIMTMGVKGVAFLKELLVAHRFGTSDIVDAYVVAMLLPSVAAMAVGNAFRDAFVPVYATFRLKRPAQAERFFSETVWICFIILFFLSILAIFLSGPLMNLLAAGFSEEKTRLSARLFRLVAIYTVCVGLAHLLKGYLQAHDRFLISSAAPALIPGTIMATLLLAPGEADGDHLALSTLAGAVALLATLAFSCYRIDPARPLKPPRLHSAAPPILRQVAPLFAGSVVVESYLFVDTLMVSTLPAGSVAILTYGERICGVFSIIGTAIAQSIFPHVSALVARGDWKIFRRTILGFSGLTLIATAPLVWIFWYYAEPIVQLIFERGEFTASDTAQVAEVLRFASFQVPGCILLALSARAVIALRSNRFIVVSAVIGLALNVALNLLFISWFGVKGVALSTAVVNFISAGLMYGWCELKLRKLNTL